jgi:hypothetical protein
MMPPTQKWRKIVKSSLVGATAVLLSLTAMSSTATAAGCAQYDPTCQTYAAPAQSNAGANRAARGSEAARMSTRGYERHASARLERRHLESDRYGGNGYYTARNDRPEFWPGDVVGGAAGAAEGVAAGAVGAAGAIATAADSYAYFDNGYGGWGQQSYAERNGFVCTPGTYFKGADGRRHPCQ